ncbi:MAG: N-6 DNA methylase [Pseudomonadota bacterium]|nr:N-6 DNA methylase [Pseudomonadota bacterium]
MDSSVDAIAAPLAWLLALRWAEAEDGEQETMAAFNNEEHTPILPRDFDWHAVVEGGVGDSELATSLWPRVRRALGLPEGRAYWMQTPAGFDGRLVAEMAAWVRSLPFDTAADRRAAGDAFSDLILRVAGGSRFASEFTSPASLARMAVALADPKPGERVYDPCCGTGSWLVGAAGAMWEQGLRMSPGEWAQASERPVFGVEMNPASHLVSFVRLMLAGFKPALELGDALERSAAGRHHQQGFDVVLANPPWGIDVARSDLYDFPVRARTIEGYFLQHAAQSLRPGGRAVVALPSAFLSRAGADEEIRKWLVDGFRLDAVVNFPTGSFKGFTNVAVSLVAFRRAPAVAELRILDLHALPDSVAGCRFIAEALRSPDPSVEAHELRRVDLARLRQDAYRFVVPAEDQATSASLRDLGEQAPLRALGEVADIRRGYRPRRGEVYEGGPGGLGNGAALAGSDGARSGGGDGQPTRPPGGREVPFVRVTDLLGARFQLGRRFLVSGVGAAGAVAPEDILLSISGTIGKTAPGDRTHWMDRPANERVEAAPVVSGDIALIRPKEGVDRWYLLATLQSAPVQAALRAQAVGGTIRHLSRGDLARIKVPVPELAVQARVVRHLQARGGDAVDVLALLLQGDDEDALTRLLHEHPGIQRIVAGGLDEATEDALVMDVLRSLHGLSGSPGSGVDGAPADAQRWLTLMQMVAPVVFPERGAPSGIIPHEVYNTAELVFRTAVQQMGEPASPAARQAARLASSLIAWVPRAKSRAAAHYVLTAEYRGESSDGLGNGTADVRVSLTGSAGLRRVLVSAIPGSGNAIDLGDIGPGESRTIKVELAEEQAVGRSEESVSFDVELFWTGLRWDGAEAEGSIPVDVYFSLAPELEEDLDVDIGTSPYKPGAVIDNPALFKGRKDVLDAILRHVQGGVKVILLEGNRRAGKTSILRRLKSPELGLTKDWLIVECSFQGSSGDATTAGISTAEIFRLMIEEIGMACSKAGLRVPLPNMPDDLEPRRFRAKFLDASFELVASRDPYTALRSYVDDVVEAIAPRHLLLMLDEFDKVQDGIDSHVTSPQVPENIRHLLQTREGVAAILTGSRRLKRLREEYWSALFGFGYRVPVVALDPAAARDLVTSPVGDRVRYDPAVVDAIVEESARQPYIIQYVCAKVFDVLAERQRDRATPAVLDEALRRTVEDYEHLTALWGYAGRRDAGSVLPPVGERRRYVLCLIDRLAGGSDRLSAELVRSRLDAEGLVVSSKALHGDLDALVELELLETANRGSGPEYRIAIPLFGRWMRRHQDYAHQLQLALEECRAGGAT